MKTLLNEVKQTHFPTYADFENINQHWLFFNSYGLIHYGGESWKQFSYLRRESLINAQHSEEGCLNGSWDWDTPGNSHHGKKVGRLLSTAYAKLALQVSPLVARTEIQVLK